MQKFSLDRTKIVAAEKALQGKPLIQYPVKSPTTKSTPSPGTEQPVVLQVPKTSKFPNTREYGKDGKTITEICPVRPPDKFGDDGQ